MFNFIKKTYRACQKITDISYQHVSQWLKKLVSKRSKTYESLKKLPKKLKNYYLTICKKLSKKFEQKPIQTIAIFILVPFSFCKLGIFRFGIYFVNFVRVEFLSLFGSLVLTGLLANSSLFLSKNLDCEGEEYWQKRMKPNLNSSMKTFLNLTSKLGNVGLALISLCSTLLFLREEIHKKNDDYVYLRALNTLKSYLSCVLIQLLVSGIFRGGRPSWQESPKWRPLQKIHPPKSIQKYFQKIFRNGHHQEETIASPIQAPTDTQPPLLFRGLSHQVQGQNQGQHHQFGEGKTWSGHASTATFASVSLGILAEEVLQTCAKTLPWPLKPGIEFSGSLLKFSTPAFGAACALSRVHDRAHYPSQAMGGMLLGLIAAKHRS